MSGKASLRIVELLERARIEGAWTHVSQYAEQLPREYSVLKFVSLGECLLEGQQNGKVSYNSLHLAKDYINKALNSKNDREGQYYKEAMLLQAKTCYIQGRFQECLDIVDKVDMDSMSKEVLTFNASRALADAYVYKGMAMEYLQIVSLDEDKKIDAIIECYETAGDLGLELLNSISRSTLNLTLSGVLEIALLRSFLLQMSHGMMEKGLNRLRKILQTSDMPGSDGLRLTLSLTLGQVLLQGLPDNDWRPLVHHETPSDTLTKRGRTTPTLKKYETVFCPCNKVEEALLSLLISQALLYKEGCVSVHLEDSVRYKQANKQAHLLLNMLVSLLSKYSQYRPLSDAVEKFLKYSHDDEHVCKQFGLALISSEQYVRGVSVLLKCHKRKVDVSIALLLVQTYVRHLQRYRDAIQICEECLEEAEMDAHIKSRVFLYRGVAEAAVCRSSRLREEQNLFNKKSIESFYKSYSLDSNCSLTWYHLALRLACVGEIKKAFRFAHKVEASPGVVNMVDVSHLLGLVLSAQNKVEEALNMVTLTLMNYPDNLNLLITKVMLERKVHGGHKALVTCKEVLLPLLEKLSTSTSKETRDQTYLPYSDQWTSGKFQLSQWSDRLSTHTTASFTGSTMGTLPPESLCESIDSTIGCDQSNWGFQAEVWYTIADVFLSEEMILDAQKCVDEIKLLFPLSHLVSYMNARIRETEGSKKEAEQQYINAVTLTPLHVPSLVALGRLQIELKKPILAEHYLVEATHLKPDEYEAWHYLGVLHQQQGSHKKAADCFMTALRFESSAPIRPCSVLNWKL